MNQFINESDLNAIRAVSFILIGAGFVLGCFALFAFLDRFIPPSAAILVVSSIVMATGVMMNRWVKNILVATQVANRLERN